MAGEQDVTCHRGSECQGLDVIFSWQNSKTCHLFGLGEEGTLIGRAELILARKVHPLWPGMVYFYMRTTCWHREITGR